MTSLSLAAAGHIRWDSEQAAARPAAALAIALPGLVCNSGVEADGKAVKMQPARPAELSDRAS